MAVIKAVREGKSLNRIMSYVGKKAEIATGKDCADDYKKAVLEMERTKSIMTKPGGRLYKHYTQSFLPGELTAAQAHAIGRIWAEVNFKGYEVFVATHTDRGHIHNHFIVNSVNFETGRKIQMPKNRLEALKTTSDRLCLEYGLSVIDRAKAPALGEVRAYEMEKYQPITQGKSRLITVAMSIDAAVTKSTNKSEFIKAMNAVGISVHWSENRKHITFVDARGRKIRADNIAKTLNDKKFTKEGILSELQRNQEKAIANVRSICDRSGRNVNGIGGASQASARTGNEPRECPFTEGISGIIRRIETIKSGIPTVSEEPKRGNKKVKIKNRENGIEI